jgi:hypothetical protein
MSSVIRIKAADSPKISVNFCQTARCRIPQYNILHSQCLVHFKSNNTVHNDNWWQIRCAGLEMCPGRLCRQEFANHPLQGKWEPTAPYSDISLNASSELAPLLHPTGFQSSQIRTEFTKQTSHCEWEELNEGLHVTVRAVHALLKPVFPNHRIWPCT